MESDEEIRRVPEIEGEAAGVSASGRDAGSNGGPDRVQGSGEGTRKRGRSPADKENKRLKRLAGLGFGKLSNHILPRQHLVPLCDDVVISEVEPDHVV